MQMNCFMRIAHDLFFDQVGRRGCEEAFFLDLDSERAQFRLNRHWEKGLLNEVMMSIDQSGRVIAV